MIVPYAYWKNTNRAKSNNQPTACPSLLGPGLFRGKSWITSVPPSIPFKRYTAVKLAPQRELVNVKTTLPDSVHTQLQNEQSINQSFYLLVSSTI